MVKESVNVRILGISGTPIKDGNCDILVKETLKAAKELDGGIGTVETEFITLAGKKVEMCRHCQWCIEHKSPCNVKDDAPAIIKKMTESDGIIFGGPTWFLTLAPPLVNLFSRSRYYSFFTTKMRNKAAGYLTLGFFGFGMEQALDTMENMTKQAMLPVARGWSMVSTAAFGERPQYIEEGVLGDKAGLLRARLVAFKVVEIARMIKFATEHNIVLPSDYLRTPVGGRLSPRERVLADGVWRDK